MNKEKETAEKLALIVHEMNEALKVFPREIAMILYAGQTASGDTDMIVPEGVTLTKGNHAEASRQMNKMMEEARLKWEYASDSQKKQVMAMEQVIQSGNEKIRKLYDSSSL